MASLMASLSMLASELMEKEDEAREEIDLPERKDRCRE